MKKLLSSRRHQYLVMASIFLIAVALIAGMVGCGGGYTPPSEDLEIRTWYDLGAVRNNLGGHHTLMNDLDAATAGYAELASPTANQELGWQVIGLRYQSAFDGSFDGQGYEIRDLFINRPDEASAGVFGFVGEGAVIQDIGVVNATLTAAHQVGGLVGYNCGTVSDSYASGAMHGDWAVGGLVGLNLYGSVNKSYSSGNVTGDYHVGGLVGGNYGTVSNSYSTGNVTGSHRVGGLIGFNDGTVSNSYTSGTVNGNDFVGGLVGGNYGTVSNSFWDTETSGQATSDGGTGRNTTEMQNIATFSGAGWDIILVTLNHTNPIDIWNIVNNVTYPFLSWQS